MTKLLLSHMRRNPLSWSDIFRARRAPTAAELAASALEDTRCELLEHSASAEYHAAMRDMLVKREARLRAAVDRLTAGRTA